MATLTTDLADKARVALSVHYEHAGLPDPKAEREAFLLESMALIFRVMATFEEKSRAFVQGLMAEHGR